MLCTKALETIDKSPRISSIGDRRDGPVLLRGSEILPQTIICMRLVKNRKRLVTVKMLQSLREEGEQNMEKSVGASLFWDVTARTRVSSEFAPAVSV